MKHFIKTVLTTATAVCCMAVPNFSASCATVDDCAAVARSYGVSESAIQSAYNAYYADPDSYTSEDFDMIIDTLHIYGTDSNAMIKEYFGITDDSDVSSETESPSEETSSTTEQPSENNGVVSDSGNSSNSGSTGSSSDNNSGYVSPIQPSDFINMTMDEKIEFVNSLPESERGTFIENLSQEEKNSIIKNFSVEDKTEILSKFADAGSAMGLNFTIDEITDDSVSMSIRNQDGTLVDQSSLGIIVEDTGYDYTVLFTVISGCIVLSSIGIYLMFKKLSKEENNNER